MTSMRMNKSGSQSINSTTPTVITNWTADGGYPATSIVSHKLVVDTTGSYDISCVISRGNADLNTPLSIWVNNVQETTYSASTSSGLKTIPTITRSLVAGDVVDARARKGASGDDAFTVNASGTYLMLTALSTAHNGDVSQSVTADPSAVVQYAAAGSGSLSETAGLTAGSVLSRVLDAAAAVTAAVTAAVQPTRNVVSDTVVSVSGSAVVGRDAGGMSALATTVGMSAAIGRDAGVVSALAVSVGVSGVASNGRTMVSDTSVTAGMSSAVLRETYGSAVLAVSVAGSAAGQIDKGGAAVMSTSVGVVATVSNGRAGAVSAVSTVIGSAVLQSDRLASASAAVTVTGSGSAVLARVLDSTSLFTVVPVAAAVRSMSVDGSRGVAVSATALLGIVRNGAATSVVSVVMLAELRSTLKIGWDRVVRVEGELRLTRVVAESRMYFVPAPNSLVLV